jgi:hypothetical protein
MAFETDDGSMGSPGVSKLISRSEFRVVLRSVVRCLRGELNVPGLAPLSPEEILFWFHNITEEDIETVNREIDAEPANRPDSPSRVHSVLQRIREKMRGGELASKDDPAEDPSEKPGENAGERPSN